MDDTRFEFLDHSRQKTGGELRNRQIPPASKLAAESHRHVFDFKRQKQLRSILNLLRYAETEIAELNLDTSAILLEAIVVDLARNLEFRPRGCSTPEPTA
ncbi:hypothetical protein CWO91_29415 [Bradyrhizobium genosp. SA-3]|nr:hypothetical protein CWO91_29415 [Bradyrhizobium genosp. SA-3]